MSDERVELRKAKLAVLAGLKETAMAALERRGYDVRGKTTSQIREIMRHHPTRPKTAA